MPTILAIPFGDLLGRDGAVIGQERLCNLPYALDLNVEVDLTFSVITKDLAMQIPQIDNLVVYKVIVEIMLTNFFL